MMWLLCDRNGDMGETGVMRTIEQCSMANGSLSSGLELRGIIHSNSASPLTFLSQSLLDYCYITPSWHHGSFRRVDWRSSWLPEPQSMTMVALWPGRLALTLEVAVVDTDWEEREWWPWLEHWHWRHATVSLCLQLHSTLYTDDGLHCTRNRN